MIVKKQNYLLLFLFLFHDRAILHQLRLGPVRLIDSRLSNGGRKKRRKKGSFSHEPGLSRFEISFKIYVLSFKIHFAQVRQSRHRMNEKTNRWISPVSLLLLLLLAAALLLLHCFVSPLSSTAQAS